MKILLVEDDLDLVKVLNKILILNGYIVDCANDGIEALDYLNINSYDLVIMDIMMPRLDGISTLKKIRKDGNSVPVLLLTAKSMVDDKVEGLDNGADDYMTKPFQSKELLARIRALTRRQNQITTMSVGNLTLDLNTYEMSAEKTIKLTNKEFKVMEVLIRNTNSYLGSEKIMDSIYDISSDTEIGVIWVFISSLRKKLDEIGSNYNIVTRKGVGYRLESTQKND
mgnify:FL=1